MRKLLTILALLALTSMPASAEISISIGINLSQYPNLQPVPGYPVYYAPRLRANYFFYDGLYWAYVREGWYVSPWYDGPWSQVPFDSVPLPVLRVPLRYYGLPPLTFRNWGPNEPPRWNAVWGQEWARRHDEWKRWDPSTAPPPAPLPTYQKQFARSNYPDETRRRELIQQHYNYTPRDAQVRQHWQSAIVDSSQRPPQRSEMPRVAPDRPPEHARPQAETTRAAPSADRSRDTDRGPAAKARPEHGAAPDKAKGGDAKAGSKADKKADKRGDHDSGKRE